MTEQELNRLAAEKVLGWHIVYVRGYSISHFLGGHYGTFDECENACEIDRRDVKPIALYSTEYGTSFGYGPDNWNPCQNISQAFQIVEKMREKGFYMELHSPLRVCNAKWFCYFDQFGTKTLQWSVLNQNPARAITEAAVEAMQ